MLTASSSPSLLPTSAPHGGWRQRAAAGGRAAPCGCRGRGFSAFHGGVPRMPAAVSAGFWGLQQGERQVFSRGRQEEDADHLLQEPGLPAGVHLRREALPEQRRAGRPGRRAAPHRDAGEDLVPEPPQQAQETAVGRARGSGPSGAPRGAPTASRCLFLLPGPIQGQRPAQPLPAASPLPSALPRQRRPLPLPSRPGQALQPAGRGRIASPPGGRWSLWLRRATVRFRPDPQQLLPGSGSLTRGRVPPCQSFNKRCPPLETEKNGAAKETGMRCVSLPSADPPRPRFRKDDILPQSTGMVSSRLPRHRASTRERWLQPHPLRTLLYLTFSAFSTPPINVSPSLTLSKCRHLSKSP